jgi:hypothetical protein
MSSIAMKMANLMLRRFLEPPSAAEVLRSEVGRVSVRIAAAKWLAKVTGVRKVRATVTVRVPKVPAMEIVLVRKVLVTVTVLDPKDHATATVHGLRVLVMETARGLKVGRVVIVPRVGLAIVRKVGLALVPREADRVAMVDVLATSSHGSIRTAMGASRRKKRLSG